MSMALANETRTELARFVKDTHELPPREGANVVADVFVKDHTDRILGAARVPYLLEAVGGLPADRVHRLLLLAHCTRGARRLRDLPHRERAAVAAALRLWGEGAA